MAHRNLHLEWCLFPNLKDFLLLDPAAALWREAEIKIPEETPKDETHLDPSEAKDVLSAWVPEEMGCFGYFKAVKN